MHRQKVERAAMHEARRQAKAEREHAIQVYQQKRAMKEARERARRHHAHQKRAAAQNVVDTVEEVVNSR